MSSTRSPRVTSAPTWQKGPMRTSSPSRAPASTAAVACTLPRAILSFFLIFVGVDDHGTDLGLRHQLSIDLGLAVEAPRLAAAAYLAHVIVQLVAGQHRLAEFG